jgi:hypothetical protein
MKIDYSRIPALMAAARRERARAIYRLLIAPLIAQFSARPVRRAPMLRRSANGGARSACG